VDECCLFSKEVWEEGKKQIDAKKDCKTPQGS